MLLNSCSLFSFIQAALRAVAPRPLATVKEEVADVKEDDKKDEGAMETDDKSAEVDKEKAEPKEIPVPAAVPLTEEEKALQDRITNLDGILGGDTTINMHLQFQIRTNKCDLQVLKNTKDAVRNSVCHNGTVIANGFMHAGTTSDQFLRDNLDWLSRATNWAKFTATASLGVIHKGHEKEALNLMATYLPKESGPGSAYSEGGGLYALGLIHANHGKAIMEYLLQQLKDATTDVVRHGGCLGLGLAAMGTAREDIYEQLKFNLFQDDAVTGEAAGLAMGLVMLGTKSASAIEDMVSYAQETQHEKILRGLAVGISLTMYGRLEEADALIDSLMHDKDPILRWSGMYTIAMAYCGTGSNKAIRKLLHIAVSDVNDDVRRAAVTSLGFLLFRTPEQCPSVVSLLSESYNPHVRYGAAMALGIACAGSGLKEAIGLLEPMVNDPVNYVRQGSLIASAMILVEHNEQTCSRMAHFRQLYAKVISDKHEDVMAKMGAILAQGIIDAGGRNMTMNLQSRTGHTNMAAVVGCLVFCQHWYWYPLSHFLALSFVPTTLIGLNSNLQMPKLEFRSNAKPSQYAYAPPLEEKKDKHKEKVETAVLSITAKAAKLKKKDSDKKKDDEKMEVDEDVPPEKEDKKDNKEQDEKVDEKKADDKKSEKEAEVKSEGNKKDANKKEGDQKDGDKKEGDKKEVDKKEKTPEPAFEMLANPARVMKAQLRVIRIPEACRYTTLKDVTHGGILMMTDTKPEEKEDIIEPVVAGGPQIDEEDEPEPPEPFEWTED